MSDFVMRILSLSLAGTLTFLFLLAAETVLSRFLTCRWRYYARLVALAVFTVPLSLPAFLLPATPAGEAPFAAVPVQVLCDISGSLALPQAPPVPGLFRFLPFVWACGAALFALWRLLAWLRFSAAMRRISQPAGEPEQNALDDCMHGMNLRRRVALRICPGVGAPALVGIFRPVLLLPREAIPDRELACILRHELIHLRRADILYKLAAQAVNAAHWFNPFAWLLARQVNALCELSCDEAAVRGLAPMQRRQYGLAILNQIESSRKELPQSIPAFVGAKQMLKKRLVVIMDTPKKSKIILTVVAALAICSVGATAALALNPAVSADTPDSIIISGADASSESDSVLFSFTGPISDNAAYRYVSVTYKGLENHMGTDIVAPSGTKILAAEDGTVAYAQEGGASAYGNYVVINHGNDYKTLYAQCETLLVKQGDSVKQGQTIATVGSTGFSTGPHLHFELRKGVDSVDAEEYIEMENIMPAK